MKKIAKIGLFSHFFEHENLGCSALSISNILLISQALKEINIDAKFYAFQTYKNKEKIVVNDNFQVRRIESMRLTDAFCHPLKYRSASWLDGINCVFNINGGDGFTDIYGIKRMIAEVAPYFSVKKKKIFSVVSPQTLGPFDTRIGNYLASKVFKKVDFVFSRDSASTFCLKKVCKNFPSNSCEVIDVAFALPFTRREVIKNSIGINVSGLLYNGGYNHKNYFGLSVDYKLFIERLIGELISCGYQVHLIGHVNSYDNEIEDDYRVCKKIHEKYPETILAPRFVDPRDAKSYISSMDFFTGARMHSTIAAISSNTKVIPMAYSRKVNGLFCLSLNYNYILDLKDNNTIEGYIKQFMNYLEKGEEMIGALLLSEAVYKQKIDLYKEKIKEIFLNNHLYEEID